MYLHWDKKAISDFSDENISSLYSSGYVFTRIGRGVMHQTRSVRIDLSRFEPSSENRRILKKVAGISLTAVQLPLAEYDYRIGKLAKDFYDTKFTPGIMSAQKVKEMLVDSEKSNFNTLLMFTAEQGEAHLSTPSTDDKLPSSCLGYAICYSNSDLIHYSYPFYDLSVAPKDMGLGMMTMAILHAKERGLKYVYLGSLQRPGDVYKLQFQGLEWFDGKEWSGDLQAAKEMLLRPPRT